MTENEVQGAKMVENESKTGFQENLLSDHRPIHQLIRDMLVEADRVMKPLEIRNEILIRYGRPIKMYSMHVTIRRDLFKYHSDIRRYKGWYGTRRRVREYQNQSELEALNQGRRGAVYCKHTNARRRLERMPDYKKREKGWQKHYRAACWAERAQIRREENRFFWNRYDEKKRQRQLVESAEWREVFG